jgi:hypothetical protein
MTKKDYIAFAKRLAKIQDKGMRMVAAHAVADVCALDSPKFDRKRFYEAIYFAEEMAA